MFYKQFLKISEALNPEFVEEFDFWLTTLPQNNAKVITASIVSSRLAVSYSQAEIILQFAEKEHILEKVYLVKCANCDMTIATVTKEEVVNYLGELILCSNCEYNQPITTDNIYVAYKLVLKPDVSEEDIKEEIKKRMGIGESCLIRSAQNMEMKSKSKAALV